MQLLPSVVWQGLNHRDSERLLSMISGVPARMCAVEIERDDLERAVFRLEEGRGILWSRLVDVEADLATLSETKPELAERLADLRLRLEAPDRPAGSVFGPEALLARVTDRLAREA